MQSNGNYQSERNRNENRKVERFETCIFLVLSALFLTVSFFVVMSILAGKCAVVCVHMKNGKGRFIHEENNDIGVILARYQVAKGRRRRGAHTRNA